MGVRWSVRIALAVAVVALSTTSASALTLQITGGALDPAESWGCPSPGGRCSIAAQDYSLASSSGVSGSIVVDETGPAAMVRVSLHLSDATFDGPGGPIDFESVSYNATMSGFYAATTPVSIDRAFGPSSVFGRANGVPFDPPDGSRPWINVVCSYPGGTGVCDISIGEDLFGAVPTFYVLGHSWVHSFDLNVQVAPPPVPEPATAFLLALGLAGLASWARIT